jgi:hypothetical protein
VKLSHEKTVHLSHAVVKALEQAGVPLGAPVNDVRNRVLAVLREELRRAEEIDERVRRKILSQKRVIPEGSAEWDVLHRKYYEEELAALGRG